MENNIITQVTNLLKNAGLSPEITQKAVGLMDGIDMTDVAGILPELSKLGLPTQIMEQIQGFLTGQVMQNIPGGDIIGSMMKGNMPNIGGVTDVLGGMMNQSSNIAQNATEGLSNTIPNMGDMIGKVTKIEMPNMEGIGDMMNKVSDSLPKEMNIEAPTEMVKKSGGFLNSIMGMFGSKK
jgi:hypothetical protein